MLRKSQSTVHYPLPQQEQRHGSLLIFFDNEGPTHFNGFAHHLVQLGLEPEEVLQVKSIDAIFLIDLGTHSHSVCSGDSVGLIVPQEHVIIIIIKFVQVRRHICAFSNGAESDLPKPANFLQNIRNDLFFSKKDLIVLTFQKAFVQFVGRVPPRPS